MFKIAYGAGHNNFTANGIPKELWAEAENEWVLNDRVARYFAQAAKLYDVELLRVDDPFGLAPVDLKERCKAANDWGADFFLSIHHNAGINGGSGGGIVAYSYYNSVKGAQWRDAFYDALIQHTGLKGNRSAPKQTAGYYVIKNTTAPAVLLELGFMDSTTDVPVILTEEYATQCAEAIVEVLAVRGGLTRKNNTADWAASAWQKATAKGILDGTRPADAVTRQELAAVLDRLGLL